MSAIHNKAAKADGQDTTTLLPFAAPNLVVKTGRSFSRFAEPMNDKFQSCPRTACSA